MAYVPGMPRQSYDDFLRALGRGDLAPVYYLFGEEEILKEEAARAIAERGLEPQERDFNLDQRQAQGMDPETLHSLVNTLPMLAARRVVVVREIEAWRRKAAVREVLLRYLANPAPETILVLVESAPGEDKARDREPDSELAGHACAVECRQLTPDRVPRWLAHHARRLGVTFGEGAAEHLAQAIGNDLGALRSELEKLAALPESGPLDRDRVAEVIGVRHGETIEDWVEAVLDGQTSRALSRGPRVLEQAGMSGVRMVAALGTGLLGLRLARAHYDSGTRGGALQRLLLERLRYLRPYGLGDWKVTTTNWARWAEAWPGPRLRDAIRATLDADIALKGTRVSDEAGVITDLVLRLAGGRALAGRPRAAAARTPAVAGIPTAPDR
jgi:DNA polymerase-3 subunit delta